MKYIRKNVLLSLCLLFLVPNAYTTAFPTPVFTSTPITDATEDSLYSYSIKANAGQYTLAFAIKADTTLPNWLALSAGTLVTQQIGDAITGPGGIATDTQGNTYVAQLSGSSIYKITPEGVQTVWATVATSSKYGMLVLGDYLYISYYNLNKITRIALNDPSTGEVDYIASITDPLAMIEKDGFIYVAQYSANKVSRIDLSDTSVSDYVTGTPYPFGIGFDSAGTLFIASYNNKYISKFQDSVLTANIKTLSTSLSDIKIDASDNIYVSTFGLGVKKISADLSTTEDISTTGRIWGMTYDDGTLSWGINDSNKVVRLETGGILSGTPTRYDEGQYDICITATANSLSAEQCFTITVVVDKTPSLFGIETIEVNASALLTDVDLGNVTAENYLSETIQAIKPDSFLQPGVHTVVWEAVDADAHEVSANQIVKVHPIISLGKDTYVKAGASYQFKVYLNGHAPEYPLSVPYAIYGDGDVLIGSVESLSITDDNKTYAGFDITSQMTTDHTVLTVRLDPQSSVPDLNLGIKSSLFLTRVNQNMAPKVALTVEQNGQNRTQILNDANLVTITATSEDINGDTLNIVWSSENNALANTSTDSGLFIFNAQALAAGLYKITATVTESDTAEQLSNTQSVYIKVNSELPSYISDLSMNTLPDNVIAHQASEGNKYLLETEPGMTITYGRLGLQESLGGVKVSTETIDQDVLIELDALEYVNIGGYFDFEIHDLPVYGQSVKMVLPLRAAIPEEALYRKYITAIGWTDFVEDSNNNLESAAGIDGYCPPPSSDAYTQGLTAGNWCVRLTLEDGGPNDNDGIANGTVVDPGGITVINTTPSAPSVIKNSSGGGSTGLFTLLGLALIAMRRYAKKLSIVLLSIVSVNSQASTWFVDLDAGYSKADKGDYLSAVKADNVSSVDDSDLSWSLGIGYRFDDRWSVVARYIDLGQGSAELHNNGSEGHTSVAKATPVLAKGLGIETNYRFYQQQAFSSFVTLGVLTWRSELESKSEDNTIKHTEKGTDLYAGVAVAYDINAHWQTAIAYKRYFLDVNDVDNVSLKLIYQF